MALIKTRRHELFVQNYTVGRGFASGSGHTKDNHKIGSLPAEFDSTADCLRRHTLKRSPGIISKSRVSYPGPGFLSSAPWPSLPKKRYNGLINQSTDADTWSTQTLGPHGRVVLGVGA